MRWPTPKDNASPNAACNKFLGLCLTDNNHGEVTIQVPGTQTFRARLLGWDAYSLVVERDNGRVCMVIKAPGMVIAPVDQFNEKEENNG